MINHITIQISLDFDSWTASPKSKLELILDEMPPTEEFTLPSVKDTPTYRYLISIDIEDAANQVLDIVIKRYMMLRRNISNKNKIELDKILEERREPYPNSKAELNDKLKLIFGKEKSAVFHHIKNSYSSIFNAIALHLTFSTDAGVRILYRGLYELYTGDQRFFKEKIKTQSEIAKEGGIARQNRHLATKQKACELLNALTPTNGWVKDLDAYKAILPEIEEYMKKNDIRNPTKHNIKKTLRDWIKRDPLVSAAVRITQASV
ncbi:hypothetical protein [Pseudomonas sp.]|uniref:hypothetical protein n=1 Tax=Pseudomonas sp. TaxID=306 RepID=UPI003FD84D28